MFLDERVLEAAFRSSMLSSLRRQVKTIEGYKVQGFYPPETERAHRDFKDAIEVLEGIPAD